MKGQDIIYVSQAAAGTNTGDSWVNAYNDLQSALGEAASGNQIWVAQGIYVPGTLPEETFTITDGIEMYGGFLGTETLLSQRNPEVNTTTLSGDINQDDVYGVAVWYSGWNITTANSHHVMSGSGLSRSTILDGLVLEAGYVGIGFGWTFLTNSGGGLFIDNSSPTITNCLFRRNLASNGRGGAIYSSGGHPLITGCTFDENYGQFARGAGIAIMDGGDLTVISCAFSNNDMVGVDFTQALGGAIYSDNYAGTVRVADCSFTNNASTSFFATGQSPNYGGAIYSAGDSLQVYNSIFTENESHLGGAIAVFSNLLMVNTVMRDNVAFSLNGPAFSFGDRGGAIYFGGSSADGSVITNSTIVNNSAGEGSGIKNGNGAPFLLHNSIVYGNVATGEDVWILKAQIGGSVDTYYSCVEGLLQTEPGEDPPEPENFPGCIDTNPMIDNTSPLSILMDNSPCIDAGNNSYFNAIWGNEGIDGLNRFFDNLDVADTGDGLAPLIDMGASENTSSAFIVPDICSERDYTANIYDSATSQIVHTAQGIASPEEGFFIPLEITPGVYDVFIRIDGYLSKGFLGYEVTNGNNPFDLSNLINGDINNSDGININDVSELSIAFGSASGDEAYNINADIDCSGGININDASFLANNFNQLGEEQTYLE